MVCLQMQEMKSEGAEWSTSTWTQWIFNGKWKEYNKQCKKTYTTIQTMCFMSPIDSLFVSPSYIKTQKQQTIGRMDEVWHHCIGVAIESPYISRHFQHLAVDSAVMLWVYECFNFRVLVYYSFTPCSQNSWCNYPLFS